MSNDCCPEKPCDCRHWKVPTVQEILALLLVCAQIALSATDLQASGALAPFTMYAVKKFLDSKTNGNTNSITE